MANGSNFVGTSSFSLPEDILKKLRRSAFITGTATGPETTKAAIEGALSVGAERESRLAQIAEDRRQREEALAQQESQFERSQAFSRSQAEKQRKSAFAGGIAQAVSLVAGFGILKYFKVSDVRFKKDIRPLENALENILKLRGVNYKWKVDEFPGKGFTEDGQIGFIAQELEEVYPGLVHTDSEGFKSVSYEKLTAVLVEAIKELKAENDQTKDRLIAIEDKQLYSEVV